MKLCQTDDASPNQDIWMSTVHGQESMSLKKILSDGSLHEPTMSHLKMKHILFYLLAKAVWQFYDSHIMPQGWNKDNVEFLFEYRRHKGNLTVGLFLNKPLVSTRPDPSPAEDRSIAAHHFPKIRELGIMLVEILLGRSIDSYRTEYPEWLVEGQAVKLTDLLIARELYKTLIKKDGNWFESIRDAIGNCLYDQPFLPTTENKDDPNQLKNAIYEKVVRHLETVFVMYGPKDKDKEIDPVLQPPIDKKSRSSGSFDARRNRDKQEGMMQPAQ